MANIEKLESEILVLKRKVQDLQDSLLVTRHESSQRYYHMIKLGKRVSELEQKIEDLKQKE